MKKSEIKPVEQIVRDFLLSFQSKALPRSAHPDWIAEDEYGKLQTVGAWFPRTAFEKVTSKSPNLAYGRFEGWSFKFKYTKATKWYEGHGDRTEIEMSHKDFGKVLAYASRGRFAGRTPKTNKPKFKPDVFMVYETSELLVPANDFEKEIKRAAMMMKLVA